MSEYGYVTVSKYNLQVLFDALVHSMDFGSGFLDSEEVEAMRGIAVELGVDPLVATPAEFVRQYAHPFHWGVSQWQRDLPGKAGLCLAGSGRCKRSPEDPIHTKEA